MLSLKLQQKLGAALVALLASASYGLGASMVLREYSASIAFTQLEQRGMHDYGAAMRAAFNGGVFPEIKCRDAIEPHKPDTAAFAATLRDAARNIGNSCNLILDPELPSYYAATLLINHIPALFALADNPDRATNLPLTRHLVSEIGYAVRMIQSGGCPSCKLAELHYQKIQPLLLAALPDNPTVTPGDIANELITPISDALSELLQQRLRTKIGERDFAICFIVALYLLLAAASFQVMRSLFIRQELARLRERERFLQVLEEKNAALEQFAYTAAHDLKEPVRTMRCYATLLQSEQGQPQQTENAAYLVYLQDAATRAEQTVNDLLGSARQRPSEHVLCDSASVLAEALADLKPVIAAIKPTLTIGSLPVVTTMPSMLRRLFSNLLDNALKYRDPARPLRIDIRAEQRGTLWVFSIADNGRGIPPEAAAQVFAPFVRLQDERQPDGHGIGLASCKAIIEDLGGTIWLAPNNHGGTTVSFSHPA